MCSNCAGDYENPDETTEPTCEHENRSVNFSTCYLVCDDCKTVLLDLNGFIEPRLRVSR